MLNKKSNYLKIFALLILIAWFSIFFLQKIDLVDSDLGRFIKNGQDLFNGNFKVLRTNFYSFTYPNYPFINHHWATGAVFYLIWKLGGFSLLHFFGIILVLITFFIFFKIAESLSNFKIAFFLSIILIPLISYRKEVRPELFSYFFSAIFFLILWKNRARLISKKWLLVLPLIEFFWVNLHIYFFLGISILGAFLLEKIILSIKEKKWQINELLIILTFSLLAILFNPSGVRGALYPLNIYNNYGYRVLEEQPVWFLESLSSIKSPSFTLFKIVFILLILSFIFAFLQNKERIPLVIVFLTFGFGFMAFYAVRNFALFGFFALPIMANNIKIIADAKNISIDNLKSKIKFIEFTFITMFVIFVLYSYTLPQINGIFGIGLIRGINYSAKFFKQQNIKGPIFNNYDIGGYLIYHLFPKKRVFVDNRPEAYPASFFKKTYIPMQEKEEIWNQQNKKYKFNAIFFSRLDNTPWGQKFLIQRVKDKKWVPVFVDNFTIIFLKNNNLNKSIIDKYKIPKKYFKFD